MIRAWLLAAGALACGAEVALAATPPAWVRELVASVPRHESAAAVVLLDQVDVTVTADGRRRTTRRYAMRLHDRAGRDAAAIREVYVTGTGRIRAVRGWIVRAGGGARELGSRDTIDAALVNNDVFNEVRVRALGAIEDMARGDVFAAELDSDDALLFAQVEWPMQGRWPARLIRRTLTLPAGWRAESLTFNAPSIEPRWSGPTLTWDVADVPGLPDEEGMPPVTDLAPRLAVSIFGPETAPAPGQFAGWSDVSSWIHGLARASGESAHGAAAKARELIAAAPTDVARVGAIARHVQRVQYVSIQTGIGRGGGYAPRPADTVLTRNYGDCKDKAALMRAMLASLGIQSYLVAVFSGDRHYVREAWPSPQQFNHMIIGVAIDDVPAGASSVLDHSRFGRLLLFDPTDEHTPLGELPVHQQGSLGLIVAPTGGDLVRMPIAPASQHAIERTMEGRVSSSGALSISLRERSTGFYAVASRAERAILGAAGVRAAMARRVGVFLTNAKISELTVEDEGAAGAAVVTTASIEANGFAQTQSTLLVVPLPFELTGRIEIPAGGARRTALPLEPRFVTERVRLELPVGYAVDEMPQALTLDAPFGRYDVGYAIEAGHLTATRSLAIHGHTVAADQYPAARAFFERVRSADQAPVVLVRR